MRIKRTLVSILMVSALLGSLQQVRANESGSEIDKLAKILVHYSLKLKPGDEFFIRTSPAANELNVAVYREAMKAGAHVNVMTTLPQEDEIFIRYANDDQLTHMPPLIKYVIEKADAILQIAAPINTRKFGLTDKKRLSRRGKAMGKLLGIILERMAKKKVRYCETVFPTNAGAQEAGMGLLDYRDFVFKTERLQLPDPITAWKQVAEQQQKLVQRFAGKDKVLIKGKNINLSLSIKGRKFLSADGKINFPDGEIFTSPIETSANGWVHFGYPLISRGQEIEDIKLWFKDGKVIKSNAAKGEAILQSLLQTDPGASRLGELGIGTNYEIKRFSKNMLFDEKIGGTIHLAIGNGFDEIGGKNKSSIHVDMICDMSDGEIIVDGKLFYKNGQFID